jgi:polyhydroxybutyrate depolymerase
MALRLALEAADSIRGAISIAGHLPTPENLDCKTGGSISSRIGFISGTDDPINPYQGGKVTLFGFGNRGTVLSAKESARWFAQRLALTNSSIADLPQSELTLTREDWKGPGGHVMLISVAGGGHTVPQANYRFPRILGATAQNNAALEAGWELLIREK